MNPDEIITTSNVNAESDIPDRLVQEREDIYRILHNDMFYANKPRTRSHTRRVAVNEAGPSSSSGTYVRRRVGRPAGTGRRGHNEKPNDSTSSSSSSNDDFLEDPLGGIEESDSESESELDENVLDEDVYATCVGSAHVSDDDNDDEH